MKVVIFSDYICPFCFLANGLMKVLKKKHDLDVEWRSFELHPVGSPMPKIHPSHVKSVWLSVENLAKALKIPIKFPKHVCRSRKALTFSELAREHGTFDTAHDLLFNSYFIEGKNIEASNVLFEICNKLEIDPAELEKAWNGDRHASILRENKEELFGMGVTAVPTFFFDEKDPRILVGIHSMEMMERVIQKAKKS
ncbi:MAG: DsbA family oxidoreductase [Candidatus Helarchaeales archaeon]